MKIKLEQVEELGNTRPEKEDALGLRQSDNRCLITSRRGGLLLSLFHSLRWRLWECPRTIEGATVDFLRRQNLQNLWAILAAREGWTEGCTIDFTRRICFTYGLGVLHKVGGLRGRDVWTPGWNRRLFAACGEQSDPAVAAARILGRISELAQLLLSEDRSDSSK